MHLRAAVIIIWIEGGTLDGAFKTSSSKLSTSNFPTVQLPTSQVRSSNFQLYFSKLQLFCNELAWYNVATFEHLIENYQLKGTSEQETGANQNFVSWYYQQEVSSNVVWNDAINYEIAPFPTRK